MRTLPLIALSIPLSFGATLTACATSDAPSPDEAEATSEVSTPTTITITSGTALSLVAYRDVTDPVWHAADQKSPTKFVVKVHGPYWVTAVCVANFVFNGAVVGRNTNIVQTGRVLGDGATQSLTICPKPGPTTRDISGRMVQAGNVMVGGSAGSSTSNDWTFQLPVLKGTYTLYASTSDRVVIRRGLNAQRSVVIAPIDASVEGLLLAPTSFAVSNGPATRAVVRVEQQAGNFPGLVFAGSPTAALAIPTAALTPDDNQTVSLQAASVDSSLGFQRSSLLAVRHPWRIGDDPTFTLPEQFGDVSWFVDGNGDENALWSTQPAFSNFFVDSSGSGTDPTNQILHFADLSPAFVANVFLPVVTLDTQIPGFLPDWRIDRSLGYNHDLTSQRFSDALTPEHGTIETSVVSDFLSPPPVAATRATRSAAGDASFAPPGRIEP